MKSEAPAPERTVVAILRGITPAQVVDVAQVLHRAGIRCIEVPLNSPEPFASIAALAALGLRDCLIGAGTVLKTDDVQRTYDAGGRLIVAPNFDGAVIERALQLGMAVMPGIMTATEALGAIQAGAQDLKLFPAVSSGPAHLRALKSVLPAGVRIFPVGGIGAADIPGWLAAGADGFGFGSEIFRPDYPLETIAARAQGIMQALQDARLQHRNR